MGSYEWRFDSGRVCLDLVATGQPVSREQLRGAERLVEWLYGAGLVPRGTPTAPVDARWVLRFTELRSCVDQLVRAQLDGRAAASTDAALAHVNALAAGAPPGPRAVRGDGGELVKELGARPDCDGLLAAVARDAVELLTDPVARARLRQCEGDNCGRVYLDTSRGRRRRWCSSEVCGNRERVARHRRRTAAL
ncbi:CGNR zinc finger domain-containing protein [Streptomyces sp. NPDC001941]|uniref:CGNR zinc finger domain-containing protein n=1 Tax=Streptomyces sp. NPDC001941 TaxID=3154659 RepID=UPI003324AA1A